MVEYFGKKFIQIQIMKLCYLLSDCHQILLLILNSFKGNAQFIFLCKPQKSQVDVCVMKNIKKYYQQKSNCVLLQHTLRKLLKVAAFVMFPPSIMVLFEAHQRFKGQLTN